jgi:hypothetical protein
MKYQHIGAPFPLGGWRLLQLTNVAVASAWYETDGNLSEHRVAGIKVRVKIHAIIVINKGHM